MLRKIYFKEMKDSFRDRRTLLLTVMLPILMMTVMTFFYEGLISDGDDEVYQLAVDSSIGEDEENVFSSLNNVEIVSSANPEQLVKDGEAHAAIIFSPDFPSTIEGGEQGEVTLVGDSFSQKSSNLMAIIMNQLAAYEKGVITEKLQAQGIEPSVMDPFIVEQKEISAENPDVNLLAMLIPLMLSLAIGIGVGPSAADLFAGEKEKKTMEALLMTPVNRSTMLLAKYLTISSIGSIIGVITLAVVALEINFFTEHLKAAVTFNGQAPVIIGLAVLVSIIYAMFTASILMLTSIIGKTIKESQSYSTPIMMLVMFPIMIITGIGVNELSYFHFAIPFLNMFSVIKELLFGIVQYDHLFLTIASNLLCVVVIFIISRVLFMKDKWVMN